MTHRPRPARGVPLLLGTCLLAACMGQRPREVSPAEIPDLEARLQREPDNAALRVRYAAALFADNRCDQATTEAQRVQQQRPADAVAVLVVGQCAEKAQRYEDALTTYRTFLTQHAEAPGASAIRARAQLALRSYSTQLARVALQNEAQLSAQPADPNTVAVLPLTISSTDTAYQALGRGLAQILTSDLGLIQRFRLVERLQLSALLDELRLGQTERADPSTAARVGRLMQAGRMVQGAAAIPPEGAVRLEVSVVQASGEVTAPEAVAGRFRDLLRMEKDLVVALSGRLGYQLSEAERRLILENGTQNLTAFLAYSNGLLAEEAGDYQAAAQHFGDAVRADPGFQQAREDYQTAAAAVAQEAAPTQVTPVVAPAPAPGPAADAAAAAASSTKSDVATTQSEAVTQTVTQQQTQQQPQQQPPPPPPPPVNNTPSSDPPPSTVQPQTPPGATGIIRIVFRLP